MSELDDLMSLDPFTLTDPDLDKIIGGVRQHRARLASGQKTKKDVGDRPKIDLASLKINRPTVALPSSGGLTRRGLT